MTFLFQPIGEIRSCFKEKFGIPRQSGVVTASQATLELHAPYDCPEALVGLEGFSHIWVVFVFHQSIQDSWKATVRPPRLGGNQRVGVFASRAPFRPNPVGLSAVKLDSIDCEGGHCRLHLRGADLLDGTPVLDIKPYIPYADALPEARGGFAAQAPTTELVVHFSDDAASQCIALQAKGMPDLRQLIAQLLRADPRPAYRADREDKKAYAMRLYDFDVRWRVEGNRVDVLALETPGES